MGSGRRRWRISLAWWLRRCVIRRRGPVESYISQFSLQVAVVTNMVMVWETYSSIGSLETIETLLSALPLLLSNDGLQNLLCDLPESNVLLLDQQNDPGGLAVKGRRNMKNDLLDDLLDLLIGDGGFVLEGVDAATALDNVEELLGCHFGICA